MSPTLLCRSCGRIYFNAPPDQQACPHCGASLIPRKSSKPREPNGEEGRKAPRGLAPDGEPERHRLCTDTRALRQTQEDLQGLLASVDRAARRKVRFLVTELIAQSIRRSADGVTGIIDLTVGVREAAIRVEAHGPGVPVPKRSKRDEEPAPEGGVDPLSDLALFILDGLADAWGTNEAADPSIWFEVERDRSRGAVDATARRQSGVDSDPPMTPARGSASVVAVSS
jgi:predicted RNA-binding Zn-ribbon protein involved in translation (DUF1610 family)